MGRKTKITREMILQTAYELLDESGIGAVAIKSIASRLGCSTQPVSWQFGSMTELKKELFEYAAMRLYGSLEDEMKGKEAIEAFFISGKHYLKGACDHPHVFRFVNVDDTEETIGERVFGEKSIFDLQFDEEAYNMLTAQYDISAEAIGNAVRDIVIYTHGLAVMMIFDSHRLPKEAAYRMMYDVGLMMLRNIGIDVKTDIPFRTDE
ncbi:MAG: TetR family transcriptional regulator [Lachnospiraceae bacterium]|nr:TetR family transcriptional regulator [Lachnospiraceae bacterium]